MSDLPTAYLAAYAAANPRATPPVLERAGHGWVIRNEPRGRIVTRIRDDAQLVGMTSTLAGKAGREAA